MNMFSIILGINSVNVVQIYIKQDVSNVMVLNVYHVIQHMGKFLIENKYFLSYVLADGTKCSFTCTASSYINEAKTECVAAGTASCKRSADGKSCVAACTAGY